MATAPASRDLFADAPVLPGDPLRVLSLWQPWASLCFGPKLHETRSWPIPANLHGWTIGIHASKGVAPPAMVTPELDALCVRTFGPGWRGTLPRGVVLGTVRLAGHRRTEEIRDAVDTDDLAAGVWDAGRWAWTLEQPLPFIDPIPAKGMQGIWRWTMP